MVGNRQRPGVSAGRVGLSVSTAEFIDATRGVDDFLLTGIERMAR